MTLNFTSWDWGQIGIKLETKCYIPKVSKFYVGKWYVCKQVLKSQLWHVSVYFTDQNIMQSKNPVKMSFEGPEMQKSNIPTDRTQGADK